MPSTPDPHQDPAVTGVPPETPDDVRPSATGLVTGPIEGDTDVEVAGQTLEEAEGGVEGSSLDAPDD